MVESFEFQILNDDSDIVGTPESVQGGRWFTQEFGRVNSKTDTNVFPRGYPPVQVFAKEFVQFFSAVFRDYSLVWEALAIPLSHLNTSWSSRFNYFDTDIIHGFEVSRCNLELRKLETPNAWKGILATVPHDPDHIAATYYETSNES